MDTQSKRSAMDNDKRNYLRLPPELKQGHGDGVIMTGEADKDLQNKLMAMIFDVGTLEDGEAPDVVPLDDACLWVQNVMDNLDISMEYYTVLFCIITDDLLLNSRHFADAAILDILEKRKETFVPVYRNKEEFGKMKNNETARRKLPSMYKLVKPVFLDSSKRDHTVRQLKQLFNFHLGKKLNRNDQQEYQIKIELDRMKRSGAIFQTSDIDVLDSICRSSTGVQPHSMQSVSTQSDNPHSTHSESQTLKENTLAQSQNSRATTMIPEMDESHSGFGEIPVQPPPTVLHTSQKPTDTNTLLLERDLSINGELQSETKTLIEATDQRNGFSTSHSINPVESTNNESLHFDFKYEHDFSSKSKTLASNDSSQSNLRGIGTALFTLSIGAAVGAGVAFAVLK